MDIVFIGSGNVAASLIPALSKAGHNIIQIYSRNTTTAKEIASSINAEVVSDLEDISTSANCYILSVPDNAINSVAKTLPLVNGMVVHTSGTTNIDVLKPYFINCGVLYPLQTFTYGKTIADFTNVPLFVEGNSQANLLFVKTLAQSITNNVCEMTSKQRVALHIAAVFSCNFVNLLLAEAFDIAQANNFNPQYLRPLVVETINKAFELGQPAQNQTGPARRKDMITIEKHLKVLENEIEKGDIYKLLSDIIINKY